jgi:SHS2 domain-containing protein
MPFRFLEDIAIADIAFEVNSKSVSGLFEDSAAALTEVMVDRETLESRTNRKIELSAEDMDRLLYDFLSELIVIKDVDQLLLKEFDVTISDDGKSLACVAQGETIDRARHALRNDVKAVTMHMFGIKREDGGWKATVVLDI